MKESIQEMSPTVQKFVTIEIGKALSRHSLPCDSPVREDLESRAEVVGSRDCAVRARDEAGRSMSLDDRIAQLKQDQRFSHCFPQEPPRISRTDQEKLRANFTKIVSGEVVVE